MILDEAIEKEKDEIEKLKEAMNKLVEFKNSGIWNFLFKSKIEHLKIYEHEHAHIFKSRM